MFLEPHDGRSWPDRYQGRTDDGCPRRSTRRRTMALVTRSRALKDQSSGVGVEPVQISWLYRRPMDFRGGEGAPFHVAIAAQDIATDRGPDSGSAMIDPNGSIIGVGIIGVAGGGGPIDVGEIG